jgi:hypothetical protein
MLKWRLLITTLPFVLVALLVKVALRFGLGFEGMVEFSDLGVVLTGAVFLIGFMLSGTMADYKESEKLPGDVACSLEGLEENLLHAAAAKPDFDVTQVPLRMRALRGTVRDYLFKKKTQVQMLEELSAMHSIIFDAEKAGASSHAGRAMSELQNLRKSLTRLGVISRTGFLPAGYALLDTLVVLAISVLMIAKFKSPVGEFILVPFVTLIFVYMVRLIRDLDDPFGYGPSGARGAADVELVPLDELDQRRGKSLSIGAREGL